MTATPVPKSPPPPPAPPKPAAVKRHHWIVRLTHWLTFVVLAGMIMSGLEIYTAYARFGERDGPSYVNAFEGLGCPHWGGLGGWLGGGLNCPFGLMWPLIAGGVVSLSSLVVSGEWRSLLFRPRDIRGAIEMQKYSPRLRKDPPPQGKHNPLQKLAYTFIIVLGVLSVLTGFAVYKPTQFSWLTALFGGFQGARYWHFWAVWIFTGFLIVHVILVFVVDPASLRAMISGWYRGRFPSHD